MTPATANFSRWVLLGLAAVFLLPAAAIAALGGNDLLSHEVAPAAALFATGLLALVTLFLAALDRRALAAAVALLVAAGLSAALSPEQSYGKAGADRGAVLLLLLPPAAAGAVLALLSVYVGRKRFTHPTGGH